MALAEGERVTVGRAGCGAKQTLDRADLRRPWVIAKWAVRADRHAPLIRFLSARPGVGQVSGGMVSLPTGEVVAKEDPGIVHCFDKKDRHQWSLFKRGRPVRGCPPRRRARSWSPATTAPWPVTTAPGIVLAV